MSEWEDQIQTLANCADALGLAMTKLCSLYAATGAPLRLGEQAAAASSGASSALRDAADMCAAFGGPPDADAAVAGSVLGVVLRQLSTYFGEMQTASGTALATVKDEKNRRFGGGGSRSANGSSAATPVAGHSDADGRASAVPVPLADPTDGTEKKKKKKDKDKDKDKPATGEAAPDDKPHKAKKSKKHHSDDEDKPADEPPPPPREEAPPNHSVTSTGGRKAEPSSPTLGAASAETAEFIKVNSTLGDALGSTVLTMRPDRYAPLEQVVPAKLPPPRYHLGCPSLSAIVTRCFGTDAGGEMTAAQADATLDLICDALETDDIDVASFSTPSGDVDLTPGRAPSACMWRTTAAASSDEITLDSFIAFITHPAWGRCLVLHDVLQRRDGREEVVHLLRMRGGDAAVEVIVCHPSGRLAGAHRPCLAMERLYRRFLGAFFQEVALPVEDAAIRAMDEAKAARKSHDASRQSNTDKQKAAEVKEERPGGIAGLGLAIASAPLAATKAAIGALSDASQAAVFKNAFPELADEEMLAYFNCAWKTGAVLKQGYVFATRMHLCFQGTVLSGRFAIPYDEIRTMTKKKSAVVFDNAMLVSTISGEDYFLTSFVSRDEAFKTLHSAWTHSGNH